MVALKVAILILVGFQLRSIRSESVETQPPPCTEEQYRLRYHFSPTKNWSNDPNGLVYYNGTFHMFFQYHPFSTQPGSMHWGHATSKDLTIWEEIDIALEPDGLGVIYSGSAIVDSRNTTGFQTIQEIDPIVAIFTHASGPSNTIQRQSLAYSNDYGITFTKYEGNPVLVDPNSPDYRDPKVIRFENTWVMVLAVRNRVEFYTSMDLKNWTETSEFGSNPEEGNHGGTWECPDLFPLEVELENGTRKELWVLTVSVSSGAPNRGSGTQYFIGNFDGSTFTTLPWADTQWVDWGPDNYASVTFSNDPTGRAVSIGWMTNLAYAVAIPTGVWRGQMTLPRNLELRVLDEATSQYRLASVPVEELKSLRAPFSNATMRSVTLPPQTTISITGAASFAITPLMELNITMEIVGQPRFAICAYNFGGEEVCFGLNGTYWYLNREKTGNNNFNGEYSQMLHATAAREAGDGNFTIRIFTDVGSMEVFADDGLTTMTSLFFPNEPLDNVRIDYMSDVENGPGLNVEIQIWGLLCWHNPTSPTLLR